jgi:hypothetical protein
MPPEVEVDLSGRAGIVEICIHRNAISPLADPLIDAMIYIVRNNAKNVGLGDTPCTRW